jgi:ABC-type multidrug transport system fused ATPase/permease subunit
MLNSFLPIGILKNPDGLVYFNIESMQYSDNINVQNLYHDVNLINIFIWLLIIFIFIAFFGVIINISGAYEKMSYIFLTIGCLSIIFSSISCYLYFIFISKLIKIDNTLLAYIVEPFRYSYIILIILILTVLVSISYIITTLPHLFRTLRGAKSNKQELTKEKPITKSFSKHVEQKKSFNNKKQVINEDFNFKKKKELTESWLANEMNRIETTEDIEEQEFKEDLETGYIKKETMDEQITTDNKNVEHYDEKISPFSEVYKQKKDETSEVKISESFEKALFSAIDKKKKGDNSQEKIDKNKQKIVEKKEEIKKPVEAEKKEITEPAKNNDIKKEKPVKKYSVKCPECSFIFTKEKNEQGITKIKCPRCGKEGVIK